MKQFSTLRAAHFAVNPPMVPGGGDQWPGITCPFDQGGGSSGTKVPGFGDSHPCRRRRAGGTIRCDGRRAARVGGQHRPGQRGPVDALTGEPSKEAAP